MGDVAKCAWHFDRDAVGQMAIRRKTRTTWYLSSPLCQPCIDSYVAPDEDTREVLPL